MSASILRRLFGVTICVAVFAVTLPLRASTTSTASPEQQTMSCCAKHQPAKTQHHCDHQMPPSQDNYCCAACGAGLALFVTPTAVFIFSSPQGGEFSGFTARNTPRSERPPVPPPRAIAA